MSTTRPDPMDTTIAKIDLSGGQKFMKYVIMGLSVLYLIFGCVLCAVGSYATTTQAAQLAGTSVAKGIIAVGVFLLVTALLGFLSAFYELRIGLLVFFVLMTIWTIILIAIGIAVYAEASSNNVRNLLASAWAGLTVSSRVGIETGLSCCNTYSTDYVINSTYPQGYWLQYDTGACPIIPCANVNFAGCSCSVNAQCTNSSLEGCVDLMTSSLSSNLNTAGACGIAFSVIMAVGLVMTWFLMSGIRSKGYELAIQKNRARTEREQEERRRRGKGGMKIPDNVL